QFRHLARTAVSQRAQEIAHLGSWELDLVHNQLTWSDEVYRIFGLQPQELDASYEAFLEMVHPDDRLLVDAVYSGSIREGREMYEIEHRIVKRSTGEVRLVHEKCEHFRDEAGQIVRSVGMVHDISERKRAEAALRESEQKFRSAFAHAAIGFAMTTPNGRFVDANPAYCALTGYGIEELCTLEFPSLIHVQDHAENMLLIEQMLDGQIADFVVENRYFRKKKDSVWVRKSVSLVRNAEGQPQWIIALVEDITKRKQVEAALHEAHAELEKRVQERTAELAVANQELVRETTERREIERQLRLQTTAMEAAANGILITDYQGNIQWANPAIARISGYHASELIGRTPRIFNGGRHDAGYYRQMWETIYQGQVWQGETINRRKDGTLYVEEQTITPVRADHGQISHFIAIKQDITERKQAEEKLEQRNAELQIISTAERNQRQFSEALIEAALILNRSLKLSEVLSLILEQIRGTIPYQFANILFLEGDSFYDASHLGEPGWRSTQGDINSRFLLEDFPLLNRMRLSGMPVLIRDSREEPDWTLIEGFAWVRSLLSVPLLVDNKVIGFVSLFSDQHGFFTQQMSDRLAVFAVHAAVAIQNAWLFEQVQASTERLQSLSRRLVEIQENERLHISRELHDEAGQVLTSLLVDLRMLEKKSSQPDAILKIVAEMERSLNGVIENLHRMAMALRPASLDHVGLVAALRQHVEAVTEKHGIQASFRTGGVIERLPANVETILYRTVQEALANVVRHAQATRVDVVMMVREDKLVVLVEDDGVGFDPETVSTEDHLGLFGIRERSEMIGATLVVESEPGKGTTIMLEVGYADTITGRR
ncbi:MAG: PAS domain S-box protein, partial [Chloroflexota bacterium]